MEIFHDLYLEEKGDTRILSYSSINSFICSIHLFILFAKFSLMLSIKLPSFRTDDLELLTSFKKAYYT